MPHVNLQGGIMRNKLIAFISSALLAVFCTAAVVANAAEKRDQSYLKTNYRTLYKTNVAVAESPTREIVQEASTADIKYSHPDFKTKDEWALIHSDLIDGAGMQTGYFIDTHEDGSHTFGIFKGTIKNTSKADGSWESVWEGTYEYRGGSGKYKNIKGSGKYKGKASSQDPSGREEGWEKVEY
jgi:hypothetical protein